MNGPQIKTILERAYRNYFYYKYYDSADPKWGGYSHYTTCMIDIDSVGEIIYTDTYPTMPDGNNVFSLKVNGTPIDFTDADTYYNVSTVNYLAAGSCNNTDGGVTLWPLDQIVADTQYYVRDAVTEFIQSTETPDPINPQIESRVIFNVPATQLELSSTDIAGPYYKGTTKEFHVMLENPATGTTYSNVLLRFRIPNATLADINSLEYQVAGGTWLPMPLNQDGADLVGYFGPPTGFPLSAPYLAFTTFRINFATAGNIDFSITLDDLTPDPDVTLATLTGTAVVNQILKSYLPMISR
jgi:hypothetical protein